MENEITAHKAGTVAELPIAVGASVATGDTLAVITRRRRRSAPPAATRCCVVDPPLARPLAVAPCRADARCARRRLDPAGAVPTVEATSSLAGRAAPARVRSGAPWPGTTVLTAARTSGPQPRERRQVGVGRAALGDPRDLDRREVVAADEHARATGRRYAVPSAVWPVGRVQLELALAAEVEQARDRQRLERAERQRRAARRRSAPRRTRAAPAAASPGSARKPRARSSRRTPSDAPGNASRAEQVVPVGVRRQQAGDGEPGLLEHARERLELVGEAPASRSGTPRRRRGRRCRSSARTR